MLILNWGQYVLGYLLYIRKKAVNGASTHWSNLAPAMMEKNVLFMYVSGTERKIKNEAIQIITATTKTSVWCMRLKVLKSCCFFDKNMLTYFLRLNLSEIKLKPRLISSYVHSWIVSLYNIPRITLSRFETYQFRTHNFAKNLDKVGWAVSIWILRGVKFHCRGGLQEVIGKRNTTTTLFTTDCACQRKTETTN